jgi:hypothetical protein
MNFALAKELAAQDAKVFLVAGKSKCPLLGTGLIVLVYREDDKETLAQTVVDVSGTKATVDEHGLAKFLPLAPKPYAVGVTTLVDADGVLKAPDATLQTIAEHTCPVHAIAVAVLGRPAIKLLWKHDDKAVEGAKLKLDVDKYDLGATGADGIAKWTGKDPIKPAKYPCVLELADGAAAQLFSADGASKIEPAAVDVPGGKQTLTFKVRRPSWVKLRVLRAKSGKTGGTEDVADADFKLTWDDTTVKSFKTAKVASTVLAEVKDIAVVNEPATCDVVSLELAGDEVYEFIDVTTA